MRVSALMFAHQTLDARATDMYRSIVIYCNLKGTGMEKVKGPSALPGVVGFFGSLYAIMFFVGQPGAPSKWVFFPFLTWIIAAPAGAEFNNYRREKFAKERNLRVYYYSNQFGKGKFFGGYTNKAVEFSIDGVEFKKSEYSYY